MARRTTTLTPEQVLHRLRAAVLEKDFQSDVVLLAKRLGYRAYHTYDSRKSEPGFPDLVLIKEPRVIWAELKREDGKLRDDQAWWIDALKACGQEVFVWKPSDMEAIGEVLTRSTEVDQRLLSEVMERKR